MSRNCSLIIDYGVSQSPNSADITKLLMTTRVSEKVDALKTLILLIQSDETYPRLIMQVVNYCSRDEDHELKKLLLIYWEIIEKTHPDGRLKDEIVMLCNSMRNDLLSPNEYTRARTLRLVTKIHHRQMLDALLQPILENLSHRHPYVRRNAVMCLYSIFLSFGDELVPDAVVRIEELLLSETDLSTRRNALLFLFEADQGAALKYVNSTLLDQADDSAQSSSTADILQLVMLEELKKVCKANATERSRYLKAICGLATSSKSQSVLYECAGMLVALTSMPQAVKLSISTYCRLLNDQSSDNNIRIIVLDRLTELKTKHARLLQDFAVDILRCISVNSIAIRTNAISLALDLINPRNNDDIVRLLKKELLAIQGKREGMDYQEVLLKSLHKVANLFPEVTSKHSLAEVLIECCLFKEMEATGSEVARFLQQLMYSQPSLRPSVLQKLSMCFSDICSPQVYRTVLWILAEYTEAPLETLQTLLHAIGEPPFIHKKERAQTLEETEAVGEVHRTVILPDGTYGTQIVSRSSVTKRNVNISGLRRLLTEVEEVDFYTVSCLAVALTKLLFKLPDMRELQNDVILILCSLAQLKTYPRKHPQQQDYCETAFTIDPDNYERIMNCISSASGITSPDWLVRGLDVYPRGLTEAVLYIEEQAKPELPTQPDDLIVIKQLKGREGLTDMDLGDEESISMSLSLLDQDLDFERKLRHLKQLTGLSDPVYVECILSVHAYDIVLEFLVINRTATTLQNVSFELAVTGDLKLVERPQVVTLAPKQTGTVKATVKVTSTEEGIVFGNVTYDAVAGGDQTVLALNEIPIDITEYIYPAPCSEREFRHLWSTYSSEVKVPVSLEASVESFVSLLASRSNMQCLTSPQVIAAADKFLVCNFYAKSKFTEDALLSLSLELDPPRLQGTIRIRAKTRGMAKSLQDRAASMLQRLRSS
jgi:coatomer subunit beta